MIYFDECDFIRNENSLVVGQVCLQSTYTRGYQVDYWPIEHMPDALPDQLAKLSDTIWGADNSPLMQFTGLKDINGREIYEGDVVRWDGPHESEWVGAVEYTAPSFEIKWFRVPYKVGNTRLDNRVAIIGNIFENPELLTGLPDKQ